MSSSSYWRKCCRYSPDDIMYVMDENGEKKSLGVGGQGFVYLAHMCLGQGNEKTLVAVKHLVKENSQEFAQEIETISKIHHDHLVSLLGFCDESGQKILLYEYMAKGSLAAYVKMGCPVSLSWPQWLNICLGVARGLQHLHIETEENPRGITHRDVKPGNILLNENWVAKLSDFGTLKLSSIDSDKTTRLVYSSGYLAPEYQMSRRAATHSDVYSFGVVLFQVLCRKLPGEREDTYILEVDGNLAPWAEQNVDAKLKEEISADSLKEFSSIIGECLQYDPKNRPTMDDVVKKLEKVLLGPQNVAASVFKPPRPNIHVLDEELQNASQEFNPYMSQSSLERQNAAQESITYNNSDSFMERLDAAQEYNPSYKTDMCSSSRRGNCLRFSLDEIKGGTNNFDRRNIIGGRMSATVFLASLDVRSGKGKTPVAVWVLSIFTKFESLDFNIISRIRHPHIVSLIGYCKEDGKEMLVYEHMQNGSLSYHLEKRTTGSLYNLVGKRSSNSVSFSWKQWLKICLGAARGLQHLHAETDDFPEGIIHRDVVPGNILLDENWVAKLVGIESLMLTDPTIVPPIKGTLEYYAPEYIPSESHVTRKGDVYAFGIVMFQVLCRKMPEDHSDDDKYRGLNEDFGDWAMKNVSGDIKEDGLEDSLRIFTRIIGEAMRQDPSKRPNMNQVVSGLEISLMLQQHEDECRAKDSRSLSAEEIERLLSESQLGSILP